jgi:hypothetical protein
MKPVARSLAIAAVLAAAAPAAAHPGDEDRPAPPPSSYEMPASGYGAPIAYPSDGGWRDRDGSGDRDGWSGRGDRDGWRRQYGWRARELERIRADIASLDAQRAAFYQRYAYRPGKLRRFDRWYFAERAALERRRNELAWTASR